jgi:hypothetical protein
MAGKQWLGWESAKVAQAALLDASSWDPPPAISAAAQKTAALSGGRAGGELRAGARVAVRFGQHWTGGTVLAPNTAMFKSGVPMWEVRYEDGLTMGTSLAEVGEGKERSWRVDTPADYAARAARRLAEAGLVRDLAEGSRLPPSTVAIAPGLKVEARFRRSVGYFSGVVVRDNGEGTLGIAFADGDWDAAVPRKAVRGVSSQQQQQQPEAEEGKESEGGGGGGGGGGEGAATKRPVGGGRKRGRADGASASASASSHGGGSGGTKHSRPVGPAAARAAAEEAAQAKARAKARAAPPLEAGARVEAEWEKRQWFAAVVTKRKPAPAASAGGHEWVYDVVYDDGAHDYGVPREKLMASSKPRPKQVGRNRPKKQRTAQQIKAAASHDESELWATRSPRPGTVTSGGRKAAFDAAPPHRGRAALAGCGANPQQCGALLGALRRRADCWMFEQPVMPQLEPSLGAAYAELIATPMELSSVSKKLDLDGYAHVAELVADVRLVWANALTFNKDPKDAVHQAALAMSHAFEQELGRRLSTWEGPMSTDFLGKCPFEVMAIGASESNPNNNNGKLCHRLVADLLKHPLAHFFSSPVDAEALGLADYAERIATPMDLGTVLAKLGAQRYSDALGFASDVRLVWANALAYNDAETHQVHRAAKVLAREFEAKLGRASLHSTWEPAEGQRIVDSDDDTGGGGGGAGSDGDDDDEWKTDGHEWIGRRVLRRLTNKKGAEVVMAGTISRWAPPTAEDEPLWHMAHDDGDAEDLDEEEVRDGLAEYEAQQQ